MWLYDCNIKCQTKWTVSHAHRKQYHLNLYICVYHRNMTSLTTSPTMRNKFLSIKAWFIFISESIRDIESKTCASTFNPWQRPSSSIKAREKAKVSWVHSNIFQHKYDDDDVVATNNHSHKYKTHKFSKMPSVKQNYYFFFSVEHLSFDCGFVIRLDFDWRHFNFTKGTCHWTVGVAE